MILKLYDGTEIPISGIDAKGSTFTVDQADGVDAFSIYGMLTDSNLSVFTVREGEEILYTFKARVLKDMTYTGDSFRFSLADGADLARVELEDLKSSNAKLISQHKQLAEQSTDLAEQSKTLTEKSDALTEENEALKAKNHTLEAQNEALQEQLTFLEDCVIEMAEVVYA